jgi:hypothetical protein
MRSARRDLATHVSNERASLPNAKPMRAIEGIGTRVAPELKGELVAASKRVRVGTRRGSSGNRSSKLCQNCVTSPVKPAANILAYGDAPAQIDVEGSR